jgi:predicted nucleic acid-binding protein
LVYHGWQQELESVVDKLVTMKLTAREAKTARSLAQEIAEQAGSKGREVDTHIGEAQAIILALRPEHRDDILLLDELAARAVARRQG